MIEEFFPRSVDHPVRTRSSRNSAWDSLDRYPSRGYQAIPNFPEEERDENRIALNEAPAVAVWRFQEFHDAEEGVAYFPAGSESTDAS